jgi:hypothetical protein
VGRSTGAKAAAPREPLPIFRMIHDNGFFLHNVRRAKVDGVNDFPKKAFLPGKLGMFGSGDWQ